MGKTKLWSYDGSGDLLIWVASNEDFRMAINEIGAETRIRSGNGCGARGGRGEFSRYAGKHHACSRLCGNRRNGFSKPAADKMVRSGEDGHCVGDNHSAGGINWRSGVLGGAVGFVKRVFVSLIFITSDYT